jgi:hypothetical protein
VTGDRARLPTVRRRRSIAPGRAIPASPRSLPWLLGPVLVALLAVGCIGSTDQPTAASSSSPAASAPTIEPTAAPVATPEPTPEVTATPSEAPTPEPSEPDASAEPSPSGATGSEAACTGTDSNREFFAKVAATVDWAVYCPSLPARWSVDAGQYRLAGGGRLHIVYQGPGGDRFELSEGAFCDSADGCVPGGADAGSAAFGDRSGTLVTATDGSYAIVVDRGAAISWLAIGTGLDVETFKTFAADLIRLD